MKLLICAALSLFLAACAANNSAQGETSTKSDAASTAPMMITGTLTGEGVECPAMRGDDGKLYTLASDQPLPAAGTRVRIEAEAVEVSMCMQGTTVRVIRIEALAR